MYFVENSVFAVVLQSAQWVLGSPGSYSKTILRCAVVC